MRNKYKRDYTIYVGCGALFFLLYIIQYSDFWGFNSYGFPQLMLVASIFSGMYWGEKVGAIYGFFLGAMVDAVAYRTVCFNTIFMLICGYLTGILIEKFINNNFLSSIILTFVWSLIYFFMRWGIYGFILENIETQVFNSALLTVLFSIPLYGIMYLIHKKRYK